MRKILIAMDISENSLKAARYAATIPCEQTRFTLLHIFYNAWQGQASQGEDLPHHNVSFSGSTGEFQKWLRSQRIAAEEFLEGGRRALVDKGINPENVEIKIAERKKGVAQDILNELESEGYDTIVLGRGEAPGIKRFLIGSVANKIVNHARNCAVVVVE